MEKYSFFTVKFDHETGTFDFGGEFSDVMGGSMLFVNDDTDEVRWGYPETDEEIKLDALAERTLYQSLEKVKVNITP